MKIDSGLSGYGYHSRPNDIERRTEETPLRESDAPTRSNAFTVESSTLLSSSLAKALWLGVESKRSEAAGQAATQTVARPLAEEWVADRYREFSEF
ncbi:hypothetical protein REJC140_02560 [Pseudorhizobium endolithicum]|uniref:Uncharacterized protein n=1 Tax=Pseudorhizobium endolithicum TaxID=1191678 RepID=A0ABM8PG18_9HYPH|nr:hypothetical protein [Pseudorhizobium endolithicum]CAD7027909.1 hypothetical protein REJC140_02560 [Pseudorhizobium endolithicum]